MGVRHFYHSSVLKLQHKEPRGRGLFSMKEIFTFYLKSYKKIIRQSTWNSDHLMYHYRRTCTLTNLFNFIDA